MLDVFPWLCNTAISAVFGRGDRTGEAARPEVAMLDMQNGSAGILVYDSSTRPASPPSTGMFSEARGWIEGRGWMGESGEWDPGAGNIRIYGSSGSLHIFHYANKLFLNRTGRPQEQRLPAGTAPYHFAAQLQAFCLSLDRGEGATTSARDGIRALRALLAIYESEVQGHRQIMAEDG
jgi:predicted dehydrogenase